MLALESPETKSVLQLEDPLYKCVLRHGRQIDSRYLFFVNLA